MTADKIIAAMDTIIREQAYEQGHSAGLEEVQGIERGLMCDWEPIKEMIVALEMQQ